VEDRKTDVLALLIQTTDITNTELHFDVSIGNALHQHQRSGLQIFAGADAGQWPKDGLSCHGQQWRSSSHEVQTAHPTQERCGPCSTQDKSTFEDSTGALQEERLGNAYGVTMTEQVQLM
jgi:hypothetical protein